MRLSLTVIAEQNGRREVGSGGGGGRFGLGFFTDRVIEEYVDHAVNAALVAAELARPFDLEQGPLFRARRQG